MWKYIIIGWLVGSFFGLMQLMNLFKGVVGAKASG